MKPELSIILPSIRKERLVGLFESIRNSTKRSFELIIVGPHNLPDELLPYGNVKHVRDFGSPSRAGQIGALLCEGKYVFPTMADDAVFIPEAIDKNIDLLESMGGDIKDCVVCKYSESQGFSYRERYQEDSYYKMVNAYPVNPIFISPDFWIFNAVFMYNEYFQKLGAFDTIFEAACMSFADLAIRAQHDGAKVVMSEFPIIQCDHGGPSGADPTHLPIEQSQTYIDTPRFRDKYNRPLNNLNIFIDINNWKNAETIWKIRFGG